MRQGITTRYIGPSNAKGSRIKALARKRDSLGAEMSLTKQYGYGDTEEEHASAAKALAEKLGWHGLWVGGGKPEEDGFQFVNIGSEAFCDTPHTSDVFGRYGRDWFYVAKA